MGSVHFCPLTSHLPVFLPVHLLMCLKIDEVSLSGIFHLLTLMLKMCLQTQVYENTSLLFRHNHNIYEHLIHLTLIKLRILVAVAIKPWFSIPKDFHLIN